MQARAADVLWDSDPERARELFRRAWEAAEIVDTEAIAVAVGFAELDGVRAWETLGEVVKAANGAEAYTGEDSRVTWRLQTKFMVVMGSATAEDFDLLAIFRHLARADLLRAVQLAKTFTGEAPRAVATLAIARAVLEKRRDEVPATSN